MTKQTFGQINWSKISEDIIKSENSNGFKKEEDKRFYIPKIKPDGTFQALIRFLPSLDSTGLPFVKKYSHGYQGPNGWLIENCPTTIGQKCPICEENSRTWNRKDENLARERKRKLSIYSNILIIKDPQTPENNGKVFLYRYGIKIHTKIMEKINPPEGSIDEPIMVFSPIDGCNFKLNIKIIKSKNKNFPDYSSCEFTAKESLTKEQIQIAEQSVYSLAEFIDPKNFKSYEDLKARFIKVSGIDAWTADLTTNRIEKETLKEELESAPGEEVPAPELTESEAPQSNEVLEDESDQEFLARIRNDAL